MAADGSRIKSPVGDAYKKAGLSASHHRIELDLLASAVTVSAVDVADVLCAFYQDVSACGGADFDLDRRRSLGSHAEGVHPDCARSGP